MRIRLLAGAMAVALLTSCTGVVGDAWPEDGPDSLAISTGNPSGIYAIYGQELGAVIERRAGVSVTVLPSAGSIENLENLASGRADLAFSAADAAIDAVAGRGAFDEALPLRALARIYDDFLHLVVAEDSPVRRIEDLRGRSVSVGSPNSGTALIAGRLLDAAELAATDLEVHELSLDAAIEALRSGEVDALFWSGGLRTPALVELTEEFGIRMLPLEDLVDQVRSEFGSGYRHGTIPAGTYGRTESVPTLAVPNVLVVRADVPDEVAYAQVATLFAAQDEIAERVPAAAILDRTKAIFTEPVALHPGALEYYRATKE
ncbi:TAXI family TRAP transporter solute-binding subunit [Nocardioides limicola]|uniref:TAXI family TRAP transporter solute-binding subunit n=1 Tax=Nocardioides limicola TaxID=2803368 RepID=UPI00193B6268|nr:TAXI family TRAP transporter solute-binding subunit [Nocardioides sp. DJM-14]